MLMEVLERPKFQGHFGKDQMSYETVTPEESSASCPQPVLPPDSLRRTRVLKFCDKELRGWERQDLRVKVDPVKGPKQIYIIKNGGKTT